MLMVLICYHSCCQVQLKEPDSTALGVNLTEVIKVAHFNLTPETLFYVDGFDLLSFVLCSTEEPDHTDPTPPRSLRSLTPSKRG